MVFEPRLDGVRGLCIATVFLGHAEFLACGWIGVQTFFVLSGYLITGVLLDAKPVTSGAGAFFGLFYARRALRIFPVYFFFIGAIFLVGWLLHSGLGDAIKQEAAQNSPYLLTYTYNLYRTVNMQTDHSPFFSPLWSLSIEEQFYLAWPLMVFIASRKRLIQACLIIVALGPLARFLEAQWVWVPGAEGKFVAGRFVYLFTLSHVDAFALGALLNFRRDDAVVRQIVSTASRLAIPVFLLVSVCMLLVGQRLHYPLSLSSLGWWHYLPFFSGYVWGYSLINFVSFVLIARCDRPWVVVDNPVIQRLGRISYGFYIFHLPILWVVWSLSGAKQGSWSFINAADALIAFILTWLLAETSFRWLETPFLRLKRRFSARTDPADRSPASQVGELPH